MIIDVHLNLVAYATKPPNLSSTGTLIIQIQEMECVALTPDFNTGVFSFSVLAYS